MKRFKNIVYGYILILAIGLYGCSPKDDFAPLGEKTDVSDAFLAGTWKLSKVTQYDAEAVRKGFPSEKFIQFADLTTVFPSFATYSIAFSGSSYTVSNAGNAPVFLGTGGTWKFDDSKTTQRTLELTTGTAKIQAEFGSASYRLSNDKNLVLVYTRRNSDGKAIVRYFYEFTK